MLLQNGVWRLCAWLKRRRRLLLTTRNGRPMPDPAFTVTYTIPNYTYSNVKVDQLRVVGDVGYKPFKGVRTKAQAGKLEFRW